MRKRTLAALIAVVAVALAVGIGAGVSQGGAKKAARTQAVTLNLAGWTTAGGTEGQLLKQMINGFQKKFKNIKVKYTTLDPYPQQMLAKFAARKPPDVFYVDSNVFPGWQKQGLLEPLESYINSTKFSLKPFYPKLLNAFKAGGKIYGLPKGWSPLAMEYNTTMFAKAGIKSAPKTWTQLKADLVKLKAKGGLTGTARPMCLDADWARLLAFVFQNKGTFLNAKRTKATVNTPAVRNTVNFFVGLEKSGLSGTHAELGAGWCGEALGKEKAAIVFEGNWMVPTMSDTFPDVKYKIAPMIKNKAEGNLAFTVSYSMARNSSHKKEAWKLLSYLTGKQGMKIWVSKGLELPSRSDVKTVAGRGAFLKAAGAAHPWQFPPGFDKVITIAGNELSAVFEGNESVTTALKKINDAANEALKGG
jgi:multiple sugar transport system substrate-binding protein